VDFNEAENRFQTLEDQRARGLLSEEQYRAELNRIRLTDQQGRTWMLQERTGQWHVHRGGQWIAARPPKDRKAEPPPSSSSPRTIYAAPPSTKKPKSSGCLRGCLLVGVIVAGLVCLLAGGVFLLPRLFPPRSDNLALGSRETVASDPVPASGGSLVVSAPGSGVDGLRVSVPEGAYQDKRQFKISIRPIESHQFGADFNPATPLIHIDNGDALAQEPIRVEIPVDVSPDQFAMAFYYDTRTGMLEGLPLAELADDHITVVTSHFSDIVVSTIAWELLEDVTVDTGFEPGYDDWQFTNYGSAIAPGGHCAGQSVTAMWYYYEKKLGDEERGLYGRYDNNDQPLGTIDFQWDDSWGYRFASVVQRELIDWDHQSRAFFRSMGETSDHLTWNAFAYAMRLTGEPQYAAIYSNTGGHAIIAYRIEGGQIYVADPNYPGTSGRTLRYQNGAFLPYYSGANAAAISETGETAYTAIRYMAKSAMVNWDGIGSAYEKMVDGEAGNDVFPDYSLSYLTGVDETTGEYVWSPVPETLELTEEDTAAPGEKFRGTIVFRVSLPTSRFQASLFEGTDRIEAYTNNDERMVYLQTALSTGSHDLGVKVDTVSQNRLHFVDFQRIQVIYGREDLSGVWEGTWQIEEAEGILQFVEDVLVKILLMTGLTDSEAEARQAAAEAMSENPELYAPRPMRMEIEAVDPEKGDRYRIRVQLDDSTTVEEEATYREGVFSFDARSEDVSRTVFTGQLVAKEKLTGTFTTSAWGIVKDALMGSWSVDRVE